MSTPLVHPEGATPPVRDRLNLNPAHWGVRAIAEIGVAIALAAVLSWLAQAFPLRMPQGGSFGLEMLPILFIAVRRGVLPGIVAGALFGLLQLTGIAGTPYIYHPLQALLDYPLAFGALGLAGFMPVGRMDDVHNLPRLIAAVAPRDRRPARLPLPVGPDLLRRVRARLGGSLAVLDHLQPPLPACRPRSSRPSACGRCSGPTTWLSRVIACRLDEGHRSRGVRPPARRHLP